MLRLVATNGMVIIGLFPWDTVNQDVRLLAGARGIHLSV
jgi:hypothetical protein